MAPGSRHFPSYGDISRTRRGLQHSICCTVTNLPTDRLLFLGFSSPEIAVLTSEYNGSIQNVLLGLLRRTLIDYLQVHLLITYRYTY